MRIEKFKTLKVGDKIKYEHSQWENPLIGIIETVNTSYVFVKISETEDRDSCYHNVSPRQIISKIVKKKMTDTQKLNLPTGHEVFKKFQQQFIEDSTSFEMGQEGPLVPDRGSYKCGWYKSALWMRSIAEKIIKEKDAEIEKLKQGLSESKERLNDADNALVTKYEKLEKQLQISVEALNELRSEIYRCYGTEESMKERYTNFNASFFLCLEALKKIEDMDK